jgi:mannosyltransferase
MTTVPADREDPSETIIMVPGQRRPSEDLTEAMGLWEEPAPPEPLEAEWLRHAAWVLPAALTAVVAGLGAWLGRPAVVETGYYGDLMRWWDGVIGGSAVGLRGPAVVALSAAAALTAVIGTRVGGRRVGVMAGLLFAVLPTTSQWARDTRPVALTTLLVVTATLLVMILIDRPRVPVALGYAVAVGLAGITGGVVAWLVLAAHAVAVVSSARVRRTALLWLLAALVGGAAAAVPTLLGHADVLAAGEQLSGAATELPSELFGDLVVAGAVLALAFLGASLRRPAGTVTWSALIPVAGLLAASAVLPIWSAEHLLCTVPAFAVLASVAIRRFTIARGVTALLVIALLGVPAQLDQRGGTVPVWVTPT